jgi:hypothetical protein
MNDVFGPPAGPCGNCSACRHNRRMALIESAPGIGKLLSRRALLLLPLRPFR